VTADGAHEPAPGGEDEGAPSAWVPCPGCGLALPGPDERHRGLNASAACWALYGEVIGRELAHLGLLGGLHQLTVDAYEAQHAGGRARALSVAFGLVGLHLALEEGATGTEVRDAHAYLGRRHRGWPAFDPPLEPAAITVFDIAAADSPEEHAELVRRWATAVWETWRPVHGAVRRLVEERLGASWRTSIRG